MTEVESQPKTESLETSLHFHEGSGYLHDNQGRFVSLEKLSEIPWTANEVAQCQLADLPSRLNKNNLSWFFSQLVSLIKDKGTVKMRLPHPRHDRFLSDLGYQTPLLAETLESLFLSLGLAFEMVDVTYVLDEDWKTALDEGKVSAEEVAANSRQAFNVVEWIDIELRAEKSSFRPATTFGLTPDMRKQFMEQMEIQRQRGNLAAVETINKFLNGLKPNAF